MSDRVAWAVVVSVLAVWLVTTLVLPAAIHGYSPPASIGTVMGSMAGGAAAYLFAKRKGENGDDKKKPRRKKP